MFWALQQHRDWRKRIREEGRQVGWEEGRQIGWEEGRKQGLEEVRAEREARYREHLAQVARQWNIPLAELLPEEADRHCPTCGQPVMEGQAVS